MKTRNLTIAVIILITMAINFAHGQTVSSDNLYQGLDLYNENDQEQAPEQSKERKSYLPEFSGEEKTATEEDLNSSKQTKDKGLIEEAEVPDDPKHFMIKEFARFENFGTGKIQMATQQECKGNPQCTCQGGNCIQEDELKTLEIATEMQSEPYKNDVLILIGTVSNKPIHCPCAVSDDYSYYQLEDRNFKRTKGTHPEGVSVYQGTAKPNTDLWKDQTDEICQNKLALARAIDKRKDLVELGMDPKKIIILNMSALTMRAGGNLANQSVLAWRVSKEQIEYINGHNEFIPSVLTVEQVCPSCVEPQYIPFIDMPDNCGANMVNENGIMVVKIFCQPTEQAAPAKPKRKNCWVEAGLGSLAGAGTGAAVSSIQGEGGSGSGNGGDGGDASICGEDPTGCILGGAAVGALAGWLTCEILNTVESVEYHKNNR